MQAHVKKGYISEQWTLQEELIATYHFSFMIAFTPLLILLAI